MRKTMWFIIIVWLLILFNGFVFRLFLLNYDPFAHVDTPIWLSLALLFIVFVVFYNKEIKIFIKGEKL